MRLFILIAYYRFATDISLVNEVDVGVMILSTTRFLFLISTKSLNSQVNSLVMSKSESQLRVSMNYFSKTFVKTHAS